MDLVGTRFPCLTPLDVTLEGGWSPLPRRDWRGIAVASEPLVAVAFLESCGVVQWGKSERRDAGKLAVRLALLPYDADGLDVQVNFSVGLGGGRWASVLPSFACVPVIPDRRDLRTGVIERFAELPGQPRVELSMLLVARRDVQSARNGLWRVRAALAPLIPEPFQRILIYGRTGRVGQGIKEAGTS